MFVKYNPNPVQAHVGDCVIRAIAKALGITWEQSYAMLAVNGFSMGDVFTSNIVWGATLRQNGFKRFFIPDTCPDCYTIKDFAKDNPKGIFVIGTGTHAVTVIDGDYYDAWDSGNEIPAYAWYKT